MAGADEFDQANELPQQVTDAISRGNGRVVEEWVAAAHGDYARLNAVDPLHGQTALDFAIVYRQPLLVSYLLEQGVDPEHPHVKHRGRSTLELATGLLENAKGDEKPILSDIINELTESMNNKPNHNI